MATPRHNGSPEMPSEHSFKQGIEQFNQGDYYACHDTLEAIWMEASASEKPFYQGILQIAVALYHLGNHNWQGATTLLGEGIRRLEPYEPDHFGVDVSSVIDCADAWLTALQTLGPEQVAMLAAAAAGHQSWGANPVDPTAGGISRDLAGPPPAIAELDFTLPALFISLTDTSAA